MPQSGWQPHLSEPQSAGGPQHQIGDVGHDARRRQRIPVAQRFGHPRLPLQIFREMRERVALRVPLGVADFFVPSRERHRLERDEADFVAVLERELHDRPDLIVVHGVDDRDDQAHVDARSVQVLDGSELYVQQVPDLPMGVRRSVTPSNCRYAIRSPASRAWRANVGVLRESDTVGRGLDAEVAHFARVADGVEKNRRDRRLAAGELHRHLPPRLHADRIVEQFLHLVERQLVHVADLVRIHEARIAHHVAAVGQIDREHRAAPMFDGRGAVVVQRVGDGGKIASGKQRFHALQKRRVNRHGVGERTVNRAGLFDDDLAVPLDDMRGDFSGVAADQRFERLLAREDARAGLAHADRAERICRAGPPKLRSTALVALQKWRRAPRQVEMSGS